MPGAYAHITLVNEISSTNWLDKVAGFPTQAIGAVNTYLKFCNLGAVSPDMPYLMIPNEGQSQWSDLMHYEKTGDMIKAAIPYVQNLTGEAKAKCVAWLLGYAGHVGTDVTIHPVVKLKVGDYAENKREHRRCEMNQDTFIWQRTGLGSQMRDNYISYLTNCGNGTTGDLDEDVYGLWSYMIKTTYGDKVGVPSPTIHEWHKSFIFLINVSEDSKYLPRIARHLGVDGGVTYPLTPDEIEMQYITGLKTPSGKEMDYNEIFDFAKQNVTNLWLATVNGIYNGTDEYMTAIDNWNLDTGLKIDAPQTQAFWQVI